MFIHTFVKVLAFSAIAIAFPKIPAKAEPPDTTIKQALEDISKKLEDHGKKFDRLSEKLDEQSKKLTEARNDLSGFKERIDELERQIAYLQKSKSNAATERDSVLKMIAQLQSDLDAIRVQLNNRPTTAGSSPLPSAPAPSIARPALTTVGTFRITNGNFFDTEVIVNGTAYFVAPNSTADVSVPAGTFTYSVPTNMVGARTRILPAGQVFAITITP